MLEVTCSVIFIILKLLCSNLSLVGHKVLQDFGCMWNMEE